MATVLTILPEGFEEIEAVTPIDIWRRAGLHVTIAALGSSISVVGRSGITVIADSTLGSVPSEALFDLIFLPGGPGVAKLRASEDVRHILESHVAAGRRIAAICAAPLVLHDSGFLNGRRYTAHPSTETQLNAILAHEAVVTDELITTSRGAGTALAFALEVASLMTDEQTAGKVALSICTQDRS